MQHEPEGDWWNNAFDESLFSTSKREMEGIDHLEGGQVPPISIGESIDGFYNLQRRHSANTCSSLVEFELIHSMKEVAQ